MGRVSSEKAAAPSTQPHSRPPQAAACLEELEELGPEARGDGQQQGVRREQEACGARQGRRGSAEGGGASVRAARGAQGRAPSHTLTAALQRDVGSAERREAVGTVGQVPWLWRRRLGRLEPWAVGRVLAWARCDADPCHAATTHPRRCCRSSSSRAWRACGSRDCNSSRRQRARRRRRRGGGGGSLAGRRAAALAAPAAPDHHSRTVRPAQRAQAEARPKRTLCVSACGTRVGRAQGSRAVVRHRRAAAGRGWRKRIEEL